MRAFTDCERTKDELLASLALHREADNLIRGTYWARGKGCAVGCSIHDFCPGYEAAHSLYRPLFGIPRRLAYIEDVIFEGLPEAEANEWPERFVRAIEPGADLKPVPDRFMDWLFEGEDSPLGPWRQEDFMKCGARRFNGIRAEGRSAAEAAVWVANRVYTHEILAAWQKMADKLIELIEEAANERAGRM